MSFTTVLFPILAALVAPEGNFFDKNATWFSVNQQQQHFIDEIYGKRAELTNFDNKELKSWVSRDYEQLNKIAKDNGFDIQFQPFSESEFGSLSILDVMVKWIESGSKTIINSQNSVFKAVKLKKHFQVFKSNKYEYPIAMITTQSKDKVFITIADSKLKDFDLLKKIETLNLALLRKETYPERYEQLIFPMVNYNQQTNIDWIKGMRNSNEFEVNQALQQTKFKMDELGAHVESAVMVSFKECCLVRENILTIDKPFYIWIERENCSIPIFAGYIDQSSWIKN